MGAAQCSCLHLAGSQNLTGAHVDDDDDDATDDHEYSTVLTKIPISPWA